jgi:hypothetical protein
MNLLNFFAGQMTWFGKDGNITWFHPDQVTEILNFVRQRSLTSS